MPEICFQPIGRVISNYKNPKDLVFACEKGMRTETHSRIVIDENYAEGLKGLDEFSHLWIIYLLDEAKRLELITHPGPSSITDLPKVGVFASRSQYRPNHIALRLVSLLRVDGAQIYVKGLDANNGSMVLDVKPYVPGFDRPPNYKTASWYNWLDIAQT